MDDINHEEDLTLEYALGIAAFYQSNMPYEDYYKKMNIEFPELRMLPPDRFEILTSQLSGRFSRISIRRKENCLYNEAQTKIVKLLSLIKGK